MLAVHRTSDDAGELAIVGPTRMRYGRAISLVRFLADTLGEALGGL